MLKEKLEKKKLKKTKSKQVNQKNCDQIKSDFSLKFPFYLSNKTKWYECKRIEIILKLKEHSINKLFVEFLLSWDRLDLWWMTMKQIFLTKNADQKSHH